MLKPSPKWVAIYVFLGSVIPRDAFTQTTTTATTTTATTTPGSTPPSSTNTSITQPPPAGVEIQVGMGSRIGGPSISNYQSSNGVLSLTNLGRATPQLVTGLGFSFCETVASTATATASAGGITTNMTTTTPADTNAFCKNRFASRLGVFASAQFGSGSNQTVSGYSIGVTFGLGRYLRLLAGFSLTPVQEISPGFATAAAQYVTKNPTLFPGINPANLASNAYGAFDGIQTTVTVPSSGAAPTSTIYYPGAVTETHYRGGFLIGVALPINIFNLLGGNNRSGQ